MSRFSLTAVPGRKRERSRTRPPMASQITIEEGPRPQRVPQRLPEVAPINVVIYKVTDNAGDLWGKFEQTDAKLWQVQMEHGARPSALFGIRRSFEDFLRSAHSDNDSIPTTLAELEKAGVTLVLTDTEDPDGVGFIQWRTAWYVAGEEDARPVINFLLLLDDFWKHTSKRLSRELEIRLHPHTNVDIAAVWDELEYEHYTLEEPTSKLPMGIFEAQPVKGKRVVSIFIQPDGPDNVSILVSGNTWNFRSKLDAHGVSGQYVAEGEKKVYYRIMQNINVSEQGQKDRITQMLGFRVFNNLAVRVIIDTEPDEHTHVGALVSELRAMPNCHFKV